MAELWKSSWPEFLRELSAVKTSCGDDAAIARSFGGASVVWTGRVARLNFGSDLIPGVELDMGEFDVKLGDGRRINARHLYVHVSQDGIKTWQDSLVNESVEFRAQIEELTDTGPFLPVRLTDRNDDSVALRLAVRNGECVRDW